MRWPAAIRSRTGPALAVRLPPLVGPRPSAAAATASPLGARAPLRWRTACPARKCAVSEPSPAGPGLWPPSG
eukprot:6929601-Lingulodinium_polyedra.AAC.1